MAKENKGKKGLASPTKHNQMMTTSSTSHKTFFYHYIVIANVAKMNKPFG